MTRTPRTPFVEIPLTQGKVALVSPDDAERVLRHRWRAIRSKHAWYASARVNGKIVYLHRFILGYVTGDPDVDHKNGNALDCRRGNIRGATKSQNTANQRKRGKWPYRGISPHHQKWRTYIEHQSKKYWLGTYKTAEEAARAYDEAARKFHGEFACVNFPRDGERRAW